MTRDRRPEPAPLPAGDAGRGDRGARLAEPAAVVLAADALRWMIPTVARFPRTLRYGLGARIENALTDVMEELVVAQYAGGADRAVALDRANRRLQVARHLVRMAGELGALSQRRVTYAAELLVKLGRQVGAWRKGPGGTASCSIGSATRDT